MEAAQGSEEGEVGGVPAPLVVDGLPGRGHAGQVRVRVCALVPRPVEVDGALGQQRQQHGSGQDRPSVADAAGGGVDVDAEDEEGRGGKVPVARNWSMNHWPEGEGGVEALVGGDPVATH